MSQVPAVVYLNVSPTLKSFDKPLVDYLASRTSVAFWEYRQTQDEASSIPKAVTLLHQYLRSLTGPVHLVGHGLGGALALTYARNHRHQVQSLSLLSVGPQPALSWHAHYYHQRQILHCSSTRIMVQMARNLFGQCFPYPPKMTITLLEQDLYRSPSPHGLHRIVQLPQGPVSMPLWVGGSATDLIVDPSMMSGWDQYLKPIDQRWECPEGRHFFQYFRPDLVGQQLLDFWAKAATRSPMLVASA